MQITIKTIPHDKQRYETVGDWIVEKNGDLTVLVSELPDPRMSILIGVHEVIEAVLCNHRKIEQKAVDAFDIKFEEMREENPTLFGDQEPGDMKSAPYHREHVFATKVEKSLCKQLGLKWEKYEADLKQLSLL